jgi:very-short-patch-repair endonuclease
MTRIAPDIRAAARRLRRGMTPEERLLWGRLREVNRMIGTSFRRQPPVGRYVVDFADYGRRLAIEVDGSHHGAPDAEARDRVRDAWLSDQGFTVLRFWNCDVREDIEGVMQAVLDAVEATGTGRRDGAGP